VTECSLSRSYCSLRDGPSYVLLLRCRRLQPVTHEINLQHRVTGKIGNAIGGYDTTALVRCREIQHVTGIRAEIIGRGTGWASR
jgi:hypothetical protein